MRLLDRIRYWRKGRDWKPGDPMPAWKPGDPPPDWALQVRRGKRRWEKHHG